MNWILKHIVILLTALSLLMVPCTTCFAQDTEKADAVIAGQMAGDALIMRPLGLCATVIGGSIFVISLPFSLLGRNTSGAFDSLVAAPFTYTFTRPLGDF